MNHGNLFVMEPEELSIKIKESLECLIIVDCRSIMEYSTCHICDAINIGGTRNTRRDIMNGRVTLLNIVRDKIGRGYNEEDLLVVYDQCSLDSSTLQSLASRVARELALYFSRVYFLQGGFIEFQSKFCNLCWINRYKMPDEDFVTPSQSMAASQTNGNSNFKIQTTAPVALYAHSTLSRFPEDNKLDKFGLDYSINIQQCLSGPALLPSKEGPTKVLPYLLLGTQQDALSQGCILKHSITHVLNVSVDGPVCPFVSDLNFLRIPVQDNFSDKITQYFQRAFQFLDEVKTVGGRALVHCSAGISRSPTIAIGYLMKTKCISLTEAYNLVKCSRTSVCPNFNFMGQLTVYETSLRNEAAVSLPQISTIDTSQSSSNRQTKRPSRLGFLSSLLRPRHTSSPSTSLLPSPSVPFANLGINSPIEEYHHGICVDNYPTTTSIDRVQFNSCQYTSRGIRVKRGATEVDDDTLRIRKRLSLIEDATKSERDNLETDARQRSFLELESPLSSRSMSYEHINSQDQGGSMRSRSSSIVMVESCRVQECHKSTSSISSNNSHNSSILV